MKLFASALCAMFLFTFTARAGYRIGVSIPSATHGWSGGVVWNANRTKTALEAKHPGLEVIITTGANASEQVDRIENLLSKKVDALVVMAQEPGPVTAVCRTAKAQGVYLVVVSNPLAAPCQDVFVNGSNRSFGEAAADAMGKLLGGKGDILVMEGIPCPINTERVSGFTKRLNEKYPGIRILESAAAYWNQEKGLSLMENFLQKYKKIDAVWAGDDDVLKGAIVAYRESGRKDVKAFVGGGGSRPVVRMILKGDPLVRATVTYSPAMISTGIEKALEGLQNGKKPKDGIRELIIPSEIVTKENASKFYFRDSVY